MRSFIIHLPNVKSSLDSALETKKQLENIGITPEMFVGSYGPEIEKIFEKEGKFVHPVEGIVLERRKVSGTGAKGVFHSHFRLWSLCVEINEPIMVFEDDVVVYRPLKEMNFDEVLIISINYDWDMSLQWKDYLEKDNELTTAQPYTERFIPGTSGYIIKPVAAKKLIETYKNSYIISDVAMNSEIIKMEIHPQVIGRSKTMDEKESLVRRINWDTLK
jgi:glycosyl transferase family 25